MSDNKIAILATRALKTALLALLSSGESSAVLAQNLSIPISTLDTFTPATSPLATVVAAALLTPKGSGRYNIGVTISGPLAAADTVTYGAQVTAGATAVSGGATVGAWQVHQGGAVTVTGGSGPAIVSAVSQEVAAGNIGEVAMTFTFNATLTKGEASAIAIILSEVGGGHAFGAGAIQITAIELP